MSNKLHLKPKNLINFNLLTSLQIAWYQPMICEASFDINALQFASSNN